MKIDYVKLLKVAFEENCYPYADYSVKTKSGGTRAADLVYDEEGFRVFNSVLDTEAIAKGLIAGRYVLEKIQPTYYYFDENMLLAKKTDDGSELDLRNKELNNYFICSQYSEAGLKRQLKEYLCSIRSTLLPAFKPEKVKAGETAGDGQDLFELIIPAFLDRGLRSL